METGIDVLFISPFYETPFKDFAYDISNHTEVDPRFGSMSDVDELLQKAHQMGLKVILDFVPNHTSDQNDWFTRSANRERGYENFYVWHDGQPTTPEARPSVPNNWLSAYGGPSWTWNERRESYYYHAFAKEQPDLNLREARVVAELDNILSFWLAKGCDGFKIDAVCQLFEDPAFLQNPETFNNLPQTYELVAHWRRLVDDYTLATGGDNRIFVPQVWDSTLEDLMRYYQDESGTQHAQLPTNFGLINHLNSDSTAADYKISIDEYLNALPDGAVPNWFLGTHDHSRVESRMGSDQIDGLTLLLLTLPGAAFTYSGDEIEMEDYRDISWEDTTDPWACNSNPIDYKDLSRDPNRTPLVSFVIICVAFLSLFERKFSVGQLGFCRLQRGHWGRALDPSSSILPNKQLGTTTGST